MPNTAALVGAGVTGMVAAEGVSKADWKRAETVIAATGHCFWVESAERLDAVTAVSGSGPAYVFHFLEAVDLVLVLGARSRPIGSTCCPRCFP